MEKFVVEVVCVAEVVVEASNASAAKNRVLKSVFDDDDVEWSTVAHANPYEFVYGFDEQKEKKRGRRKRT